MSVSRFYELELEKLLIEFEKISYFTQHPPTLGNYREMVLRQYLREFVPPRLSIGSGFVFDHERAESNQLYHSQTKQVDCLIYDNDLFTPFLQTEDFSIIEVDALFGGIEIKSTLTFHKEYDKSSTAVSQNYPFKSFDKPYPYRYSGTLVDALKNIKSIADIANVYKKDFFKGIFAYSSKVNFRDFLFAFDCEELQKQLDIKHLDELPIYICVPDQLIASFRRVAFDEDENHGFDPFESEFSVLETVPENKSFALQLFTNALKVGLDNNLQGKIPHRRGMFTGGVGKVKQWGHHFRLDSHYRDQ